MRIAIITFSEQKDSSLHMMARELARGFSASGHNVEVMNGILDKGKKLGSFDYLCVGAELRGLFPKTVPDSFRYFFQDSGTIRSKRTLAFIGRRILGGERALSVLMRALEAEGVVLHNQEIFPDAASSRRFAEHYTF